MEFWDVVTKRESVRGYSAKPVPKAKAGKVLEAARMAPSWRNGQAWDFVLVADQKKKDAIIGNPMNDFAKSAPVLIIACGAPSRSGTRDGKDYYLVDVAIAMEQLVLAATAEGLGTCWIGTGFNEQKTKALLGIPEGVRIVAISPLGYPKKGIRHAVTKALTHIAPRRKLNEIAHWGKW